MIALFSVSCVTPRRVNYLQDMTQGSQIQIENRFEAAIAPYDELSIIVSTSSSKKELATPFNLGNSTNTSSNNSRYLVDVNGDIQMPIIGNLHVAGLTRLRLQDTLAAMLKNGGYIDEPFVMVRFNNFKVFFLGGGKGKVLNIANERCTFLEALALSGDLNQYTNRRKIAVMREVNGRMVMRYLDPRSSKIFQDPYYMLQQNDFIITQDVRYKNFLDSFRNWTPIFSVASTVVGVLSAYMTYRLYSQTQ